MDFWNILQKLKKCKNLTKSALGGVPCLKDNNDVDYNDDEYEDICKVRELKIGQEDEENED